MPVQGGDPSGSANTGNEVEKSGHDFQREECGQGCDEVDGWTIVTSRHKH